MKNGWKMLAALVVLGLVIPTAYSQRSIGVEASPLQDFAGLHNLLASQDNKQKSSYNQFFTEETLTVTKESDGILPGTLRTVLLQAAGIRHNNPFTLVRIVFDPSVKQIRVSKGNLPPITEGLINIDCSDRVVLDGSQLDSTYLGEGESVAGLTLQSSGNTVKGCQIVGFTGNGIVVTGNRNQIRENKIGSDASKATTPGSPAQALAPEDTLTNSGSGIFLGENASENSIESNEISGNKGDGITFAPQTGSGNRAIGNIFEENGKKGINSNDNSNRTSRPILKPIYKEGDSYIISGTLSDMSDLEIYLASVNGREGKMAIVPLFTNGRGDFSVSVKSKGFVPGESKIVVLATSPNHNTSEFSDPGLIPAFEVKNPESATPPPPPPPPPSPTNENKDAALPAHDSNEADEVKPLNERASSALSVGNVTTPQNSGIFSPPSGSNTSSANTNGTSTPSVPDPFLNATTLPPPSPPQITPPADVKAGGVKSGESDSVRVESVTDVNGAP
jgi:hypothetical protein